MSAAARLYWPHQQQTCWHRTALNGNDTVLVDEDLEESSVGAFHGIIPPKSPDGKANQYR
jgi:hypothetical protein